MAGSECAVLSNEVIAEAWMINDGRNSDDVYIEYYFNSH